MQVISTTSTMGSAPYSNAPMMPAKKKSGCGCCGCLGGCLLILLISMGLMVASVFFLDTGKLVDRGLGIAYYQFARPWFIESIELKATPEDRQQAILIADTYVATYLNLPEDRKKPLRKELIYYIYYSSQGKPMGRDKIPNVMRLHDEVMQKVSSENPNWATPPVFNRAPTPVPTPPRLIEPQRPVAPPPPEKAMPRLTF